MKAGRLLNVKMIENIGGDKYKVVDIQNGLYGTMSVKGRLKKQTDGTIKAWLIDTNEKNDGFYCGNSYFGKYSISDGISLKYTRIISSLLNEGNSISAEDFSILKGMANRCLRFDQWDWLTTYQYLGLPDKTYLRDFVKDCVIQRDNLRESNRSQISSFVNKYSFMLNSMLFYLNQKSNIEFLNSITPASEFDQILWDKLTPDSRENITLVTKFLNNESAFLLMHFFVVLEQEFFHHFINPFIESAGYEVKNSICSTEKFSRTHNILTGQEHFSLGSIMFIGKLVTDNKALSDSQAISEFNKLLGDKVKYFRKLCFEINDYRINNLSLTKMRNGIAHGDSVTIQSVDSSCYDQLYTGFFKKPSQIIIRILNNSLNKDIHSEV